MQVGNDFDEFQGMILQSMIDPLPRLFGSSDSLIGYGESQGSTDDARTFEIWFDPFQDQARTHRENVCL